MSELRWMLLGVGLVVLVGVAGWELLRRRAGRGGRVRALVRALLERIRARSRPVARGPARRPSEEPELGALRPVDVGGSEPLRGEHIEVGDLGALASAARAVPGRGRRNGSAGPAASPRPAGAGDGERLLMVLTVMAPLGQPFEGDRLQTALETFGLEHGRMGLFHHYGGRGGDQAYPVFSIANALEPGTFKLEEMARIATPGVCLFMQLPGPLDGVVAFDLMLDIGAKLARTLGGELRDSRRSTLTRQGIQTMREQVIEHSALGGRRSERSDRVLH